VLAELERDKAIPAAAILDAVGWGPWEVQAAAVEALRTGKRALKRMLDRFDRSIRERRISAKVHSPLKQVPIIRVADLLLKHGYSERQTWKRTAELLRAHDDVRFQGLTADQVRLRYKNRAQKRRVT
jgi:hypothetical protein